MRPSNFVTPTNLGNLDQKDPTQVNSWEVMLVQLSEHLSLSEPQYETICERYNTLQRILNAGDDPILDDAHIFIQGSVGLRTTIKTTDGAEGDMATIDADAVILLPNAENASSQKVLEVIETRFREGSRVNEPVKQLRRGIRIVYADENPGFHMDITPAKLTTGNTNQAGYGLLDVPDRVTGWKGSSPRSYSLWLESVAKKKISVTMDAAELGKLHRKIAEATQDPIPEYESYIASNPLLVAIKLIKRHRDEWAIRTKNQDFRPISAILTTLAALAYEELVTESSYKRVRPLEAIYRIVEKMPKYIHFDINGDAHVKNPEDKRENFAEKWNRPNGEGDKYRAAFSAWYIAACEAFQLGFKQLETATSFENAMNESFGVSASRIKSVINEMPHNWTIPGRKEGVSLNSLSATALLGSSFTSAKSQASTEPVQRLG